jgi:dTMP kinase
VRKSEKRSGALFVFEGIDGTGKTTQAMRLVEELGRSGFEAVYFREPSDGRWGRIIREKAMEEDSLTPEEELDLFQKDRRQNVKRNLIPAIGSGKMVVLDRYYFSTMAYQGAKGISPQRIREENETFAPSPDLVFIFDLDPDTGLGRIAQRGARAVLFEREDYLEKVRAIFLGLKGREFIRVDASRSIEEVAALIKKTVFRFLRDREGGIPNSFS